MSGGTSTEAAAWEWAASRLAELLQSAKGGDPVAAQVRAVVVPHLLKQAARAVSQQLRERPKSLPALPVVADRSNVYGRLLRDLRHAHGYSLNYASSIGGVSIIELSEVENGMRPPFSTSRRHVACVSTYSTRNRRRRS